MLDIRSLIEVANRELTEQEQKDRMAQGAAIASNPVFGEVMKDVCIGALSELLESLRKRDFEKAYSQLMMMDATTDVEQLFVSMKHEVEAGGNFNLNDKTDQHSDLPHV